MIGALLAAVMGAMTGVIEALSTPYLWVIPVGAAIAGNLFLYWFASTVVGRSWGWVVAAVPWFAVMIVAIAATGEGDQLANSWTGLATFAAGAATFFLSAGARPRPEPGRG